MELFTPATCRAKMSVSKRVARNQISRKPEDASRERENAVLIITLHNNTLGNQRLTQSLRRSDHCRQQFQDVDVVSKPAEDGALERGVKALRVEIAPRAFSLAFLKPGKKPWERG